jgi:hypothetical protein
MIRLPQYLWLNAAVSCALIMLVSVELNATLEPTFYAFAHAMVAALITGLLLHVISRRGISFLGSPVLCCLVVLQLYLTLNSVKYYVPNRVYADVFRLSEFERFIGSLGASAVSVIGVGLLWLLPRTKAPEFRGWWRRDPTVVPVFWVALAVSALTKVFLIRVGYGGPYADTPYNPSRVRAYSDLLVMFAGSAFELLAFVFGAGFLITAFGQRSWRSLRTAGAVCAVAISFGWAAYMQARMPFLFLMLLAIFALQIRSHRVALLALQVFLLILPLAAVGGTNLFTVLLGRRNVAGLTMHDTVSELGYRSDLTDFAAALVLKSHGNSAGSQVVVDAATNAVPRMFWPSKDAAYQGAYYSFLQDHGFQRMDYLETPFSNGVVAFGLAGFGLWPFVYLLGLAGLASFTAFFLRHSSGRYYALLVLGLMAMRVENEWEGVLLFVRDYLLFTPILIALHTIVLVCRGLHRVVQSAVGVQPTSLNQG